MKEGLEEEKTQTKSHKKLRQRREKEKNTLATIRAILMISS